MTGSRSFRTCRETNLRRQHGARASPRQVDGGHVPNDYRGLVREALDWYDKYLGPVK